MNKAIFIIVLTAALLLHKENNYISFRITNLAYAIENNLSVDDLQKIAKENYNKSLVRLIERYNEKNHAPSKESEAFKRCLKIAEDGDAEAQLVLGAMYDIGFGVSQDHSAAFKWYQKSAQQGNVHAQLKLGYKYSNGEGIPENDIEALEWYREAADQGNSEAQVALGYRYESGIGIPQDYLEASKWYRRAAEQGNAGAQNSLGMMYALGKGVPQDFIEAYTWLNVASAKGFNGGTRDTIAEKLSPEELNQAQKRSRDYFEKYNSHQ